MVAAQPFMTPYCSPEAYHKVQGYKMVVPLHMPTWFCPLCQSTPQLKFNSHTRTFSRDCIAMSSHRRKFHDLRDMRPSSKTASYQEKRRALVFSSLLFLRGNGEVGRREELKNKRV